MKINLHLYTADEKRRIWSKHYSDVHTIKVENLSRNELILYLRELESENYVLRNDRNYYYELSRKAESYRIKAHIYKVELGRCTRKLTRLYKKLYNYAFACYALRLTDMKPDKLVNEFRNV